MYLFVLLLDYGKFFIDYTDKNDFELKDFDIFKYEWTTIYRPIKVLEFIPGCSEGDEDVHLAYYIKKYGFEHVRGRNYNKFRLLNYEKDAMNHIIESDECGCTKWCFLCNKEGHYTKDCEIMKIQCDFCRNYGHEVNNCKRKASESDGYYLLSNRKRTFCEKWCHFFC